MKAHQKLIKDNARSILKIIVKHYGCNYSFALYDLLRTHPDYPSFLSIQYILKRIGKESIAIQTGYKELLTVPLPCIVHVFTNMDLFLFVTKITPAYVLVKDECGNEEKILREDFLIMWDGNVLLIDDKKGHIVIPSKDKFDMFIRHIRIPFFIFCVLLIVTCVLCLKQEKCIVFYLHLTCLLIGLLSSIFLLIENIDQNNYLVKRLCSTRGVKSKIDCSSILDFKGAYLGGLISWSDIGFVYFVILLEILIMFPYELSRGIINVLSFCSIGYVGYSVFYQKVIAQRWCTFCLVVQGIFVCLFVLGLCSFRISDMRMIISGKIVLTLGIVIIATISTYVVIKPLLVHQKQYQILQKKFYNLIFDEHIVQYLFSKEKHIEEIDDVYKINIGDKNAKNKLVLIFNPICIPCIKKLQILLSMLQWEKNTNLGLVFLFDKEKQHEAFKLAQLFMEKYLRNPDTFAMELNDYVDNYPSSRRKLLKEIPIFQKEYIQKCLENQIEWCRARHIYSTPMLLANGVLFPEYFDHENMVYLLSYK